MFRQRDGITIIQIPILFRGTERQMGLVEPDRQEEGIVLQRIQFLDGVLCNQAIRVARVGHIGGFTSGGFVFGVTARLAAIVPEKADQESPHLSVGP